MNKSSLLLAGVVCGLCGWAQPVFTAPIPAENGQTADVLFSEYIEPTEPSGAEQAWDFSDLFGTGAGLFQMAPASTSPFVSLFDGAEWVNSTGDQLGFWANVDGDFTVYGNANSGTGVTLPFDDPLIQWQYPLEYGNAHSDAFSVDQTLFGLPYTLTGEVSMAMDAWGTLIVPGASVAVEALRGHYQQFYTETYDGDTANWFLSQHLYFAEDSVMPVLFQEVLSVTDVDGNSLLEVSDVAWYANVVLDVPEERETAWKPAHPNPVEAGETLTWGIPEGWGWRAMTLDGQCMAEGQSTSSGFTEIDTRGWARGMCLLVGEGPSGEPNRVSRLIVR